jgi:hypothetical protein
MAETTTQTNNKSVEFSGETRHEPRKRLPKHAKKYAARGLISAKQLAKMKD